MNRNTNEKFIILATTLASVGLIVENILMQWEFWVPTVIVVGIISIWAAHLSDRIDFEIRKGFYFGYSALLLFYHGIHRSSFFDISIAVILVMVTYSILCDARMMNILLLEYGILLFIQFIDLPGGEAIVYDRMNVSRILLHMAIVLLIYLLCIRSINDRLENAETDRIKEERIRSNDASMEDFLSNISHELRTPVNVVS